LKLLTNCEEKVKLRRVKMPIYLGLNDTIEGEKIYCVFERSTKPTAVSTTGRHRAQAIIINGNPATAIIVKTLRYIRD